MKQLSNLIILFSLSILQISCGKDQGKPIDSENAIEENTRVITDEFINSNPGIYLDYYTQTDFKVNIISFKDNPLNNEIITLNQTDSHPLTKGEVPFKLKINGISIDKSERTKSLSQKDFLHNLFGNNTHFTISSIITKSETKDTTITLRLPELIEITSPQIRNDSDLYPLCYSKNFILKWNGDSENKHGVLAVIEWYGHLVQGKDQAVSFRKSLVCPDTGEYTFDDSIFDEIPDRALVFITLLRGNIQNFMYNEYSYKLYGSSIAKLPIILIKNIIPR